MGSSEGVSECLGHFWCSLLCIGKSPKGKIPHNWHFYNIKKQKPPYIRSLKIIELLHFWKILGPSEENYNLQSFWITLYHHNHFNHHNHQIGARLRRHHDDHQRSDRMWLKSFKQGGSDQPSQLLQGLCCKTQSQRWRREVDLQRQSAVLDVRFSWGSCPVLGA